MKEKRFTDAAGNYVFDFMGVDDEFFSCRNTANSNVNKARKYIACNYGKKISVYDVAKACHISYSHLSHTFSAETGVGLRVYIKLYRLMKAAEFLRTTDKGIKEIAEMVGFVNMSYFCESFFRLFGISAREYRRQNDRAI